MVDDPPPARLRFRPRPARPSPLGHDGGRDEALGLSNGDVFGSVLAFSPGFLVVPAPIGRPRVFVSHGNADPVLPIDACSRSFVPALREAGYDVRFDEFEGGHTVPPPVSDGAVRWWLGAPAA
jgi:phospholipase/carboxylesterase